MIVLFHVILALSSLISSGYAFIYPSKPKLRISYGLVASTLVSGTYLVLSTHARMVQTCVTGLFYIGVTTTMMLSARSRLAAEKNN